MFLNRDSDSPSGTVASREPHTDKRSNTLQPRLEHSSFNSNKEQRDKQAAAEKAAAEKAAAEKAAAEKAAAEKRAESRFRLTEMLIESGKANSTQIKWMESIIRDLPRTKAAKRAAELLEMLK